MCLNEDFKTHNSNNSVVTNNKNKNNIDIGNNLIDVESLSDVESEGPNTFKYIILKNYPVQLIITEKLEFTLDEYVKENLIETNEWLSILFQICFGLAVAQKNINSAIMIFILLILCLKKQMKNTYTIK